MADSSVEITAGAGTQIDTRQETTNNQHRQVVVIGDPSQNAGVAPVTAANGLLVEVSNNTALTDTELRATAVPVSMAAVPTGASTLAEQQSQTTLLGTIDADTGSMASSLTSIAAEDFATQTTLAAIDSKLGGTLAVNVGLTDAELRATPVPVSGTVTANIGTIAGVATEATLSNVEGSVATIENDIGSIDLKIPSGLTVTTTRLLVDGSGVTQPVSGPLTDAELRASPVPVSGTVTANIGTIAGVATEVTLAAIDTKLAGTIDVDTGLTGLATEATLASIDAALAAPLTVNVGLTDTELRAAPVPVTESLDVVDFIDTTPVLDTGSTNIPASASAHLEIVASLAANVKRIKVNDTTGEFIGVFTGAASSEVLQCIIGPGQDDITPVVMASGERVSIRNMANAAVSIGSLCIQFIG